MAAYIFTVTPSDLSTAYLNFLLGPVYPSSAYYAPNIVQSLLIYTAQFSFFAALLTLSVTLLQGTLTSAAQGELFGKEVDSGFFMARVGVALGALVPNASGYNSVQQAFLWMVGNGVGLANSLWSLAVENTVIGSSLGGQAVYSPTTRALTTSLLSIASSLSFAYNNLGYSSAHLTPVLNSSLFAGQSAFIVELDNRVSGGQPIALAALPLNLASNASLGNDSVATVAQNLWPIIQAMATEPVLIYGARNAFNINDTDFTNNFSDSSCLGTFNSYCAVVQNTLLSSALLSNPSSAASNQLQTMTQVGWMGAGVHYWDISVQQSPQASVDMTDLCFNSSCNLQLTSAPAQSFLYLDNQISFTLDTASLGISTAQFVRKIAANAASAQKSASSTLLAPPVSSGNSMDEKIAQFFAPLTYLVMQKNNESPTGQFQNFVSLNRDLTLAMIGTMQGLFISVAVIGLYLTSGSGFTPFSTIFFTLLLFLLICCMPLLTAIISIAAIAGYFAPFIPILIFTTSALGWLISVVEGTIAAPLVVATLLVPSQDELGEAQRALMNTLAVVFKPSIIILGFMAASRIADIAILLTALGVEHYINHFFSSGIGAQGCFLLFVLFQIRNSLTIATVIRTFSILGSLPDTIFRSIGISSSDSAPPTDMVQAAYQGSQDGLAVMSEFLSMGTSLLQNAKQHMTE